MRKRWRLCLVVFLVLLLFSPPLAALTPPTVRVQGSLSAENVEFVGHIGGTVLAVALSGDHAYVAAGDGGLRVVDVADPSHPSEVGSCDPPGNAYGVAVSGNCAYVADGNLRVIDVSDPSDPSEVGSCDTLGSAYAVAVSGDHAYVADYDGGLWVVDVSDSTEPSKVGFYATSYAVDVTLSGGHVYVAGGSDGLFILYHSVDKERLFLPLIQR
ncbi:MAG: PQQ-binding-like beta-propeller repeat protein [Anaerolineae bacterium]